MTTLIELLSGHRAPTPRQAQALVQLMQEVPDLGFGPVTPATRAGQLNAEMRSYEMSPGETAMAAIRDQGGDYVADRMAAVGPALDYGRIPAQAVTGAVMDADAALAEAADDPSLANITGAGVKAGAVLASPAMMGISAGLGLGGAALRDLGFDPRIQAAEANDDATASMVKGDPQLESLYQQYEREIAASRSTVPGRSKQESAAIRAAAGERANSILNSINAMLGEQAAAKRSKEQDDYQRQVGNAESLRDRELGRVRRFSDTETGAVYDALGGYAPVAAAAGYGAASTLAKGLPKTAIDAAGRIAKGAGVGITAIHGPLAYDSFATPTDNPEKNAYEEYSYALPDGHPEKAKAAARAAPLPEANPVRDVAQRELYDPEKLQDRLLFGAIEGISGYGLGAIAPPAGKAVYDAVLRAPGDVARSVGQVPGKLYQGLREGFEPPRRRGGQASAPTSRVEPAPAQTPTPTPPTPSSGSQPQQRNKSRQPTEKSEVARASEEARSKSSRQNPLSNSDQFLIRTAVYEKLRRDGSISGLKAKDLGIDVKGKQEKIEEFVASLIAVSDDMGSAGIPGGQKQVDLMRQLSRNKRALALPAAAIGAGATLAPDPAAAEPKSLSDLMRLQSGF